MRLNVILALVAAVIWFGTYFWYFRGTARIKQDFANLFAGVSGLVRRRRD